MNKHTHRETKITCSIFYLHLFDLNLGNINRITNNDLKRICLLDYFIYSPIRFVDSIYDLRLCSNVLTISLSASAWFVKLCFNHIVSTVFQLLEDLQGSKTKILQFLLF